MMVAGLALFAIGIGLSFVHVGGEHSDDHAGAGADHHSSIQSSELVADASGDMVLFAQHEEGRDGDGEEAAHEEHADDAHADAAHDEHADAAHDEEAHAAGHDEHEAGSGSHHSHPEPGIMAKIGVPFMTGTWFVLLAAMFGVFFIGVKHLANAGWYVLIKRILEQYYVWVPAGVLLLLAGFFIFGDSLYEWKHLAEGSDALIDAKRAFLNPVFYIAIALIVAGVYFLYGMTIKKYSLNEDAEGGVSWFRKSVKASAMFMPVFALSFCALAFLAIMSIDAHWFSTIFAVYNFAGMFVIGATITALIVVYLKENNYLPNVSSEHIHDLGKFMFAFSIFWAYIWVSQYLLIWYANIPEETFYYVERFDNYFGIFALNVALNFFFPFLALMTRNAKRQYSSLKTIGAIMLFGRATDIFLMIAPGVLHEHWSVGLWIAAIGMVLLQLGVFLFLVFRGLSANSITVKNHPYLQESAHHDVGV